jgi:hypothetical protein
MECIVAMLLKCRKSFVFVLILSIMNTSISLGMNEGLQEEELELSHISRTQLRVNLENEQQEHIVDELTEGALLNSSGNISRSYVLAFRNEDEERQSKFLIFKSVTAFLTSIIVAIPNIAVAISMGDYYGSRTLGYAFVGLTFLTGGATTAWITSEFIDDTRKLVKKVKNRGINSSFCSIDTLKDLKFGLLSLVVGALSSCSDVYKAYNYNTIKELSIITFVFDVITRTLGLYKACTSLNLQLTNCASQEQNILKKRGVEYIDSSKRNFLNICKRSGVEVVSEALDDCKTPNEVYSYLTTNSRQSPSEELFSISTSNYEKGLPRKIVRGLSLIFPLSNAVFDIVMTYKGYSVIIDNPIASMILTGFSVLPMAALGTYVITRSSDNIFYKFYLYRKGLLDPDYFSIFQPKTNKVLFISSLLLVGIDSLSGFAIISDNMETTIFAPIKYVVATIGVVSGLLFGTYTIKSTMKSYGEEILKRCNKGASYIFGCLKKLGEVSNSIFTSSVDSVSDFIDQINPEPTFQ